MPKIFKLANCGAIVPRLTRGLGLGVFLALFVGPSLSANAALIEILCTSSESCDKSTGTAGDGTIFFADPNPTNPSTGTGVFDPFVRVQRAGNGGIQNGFNTDFSGPGTNFDTKTGTWTRSVQMREFDIFSIGGIDYIELKLDANEKGSATSNSNKITISEMQIFIGSDEKLKTPESYAGYYAGTLFDSGQDNTLLGLTPRWQLDNTNNGDMNIVLQASICDTAGQCGSGKGDLGVLIMASLLGTFADDDYFVFYSEYSGADIGDGADAGFEEWSFRDAPLSVVPLPAALPLYGTGLAVMGLIGWRKKRKASA